MLFPRSLSTHVEPESDNQGISILGGVAVRGRGSESSAGLVSCESLSLVARVMVKKDIAKTVVHETRFVITRIC